MVARLKESLVGRLYAKLGRDEAFNWAVIIAWNFLQSLFPIVLVMAALLGLALGSIGVGLQKVCLTVLSIMPGLAAQHQALQALGLVRRPSGVFFLVACRGRVSSG